MTMDRNTRSFFAVTLTVVAVFVWINIVATPEGLPDWAVVAGLIVTGLAFVFWIWLWLDLREVRESEEAVNEALRLPQAAGMQDWSIPTQPVRDPEPAQMPDADAREAIMPNAAGSLTDTRYARQAGVPVDEMEFDPATDPAVNQGGLPNRAPIPEVVDKPQAEGEPVEAPEPDDAAAVDVGDAQAETGGTGEAEVIEEARNGEPVAEEQVAEQSAAPPNPHPTEAEVMADAEKAKPADAGDPDDLTRIEGIGPVISRALIAAGIDTYRKVAEADPDHLRDLLKDAGVRVVSARSVDTWPRQAAYAQVSDWEALATYQSTLKAGREGGE